MASAITELGVGEALVSFLDEKGIPSPAERSFICPLGSRIGAITDAERNETVHASNVFGFYEKSIDREAAYEILQGRAAKSATEPKAD